MQSGSLQDTSPSNESHASPIPERERGRSASRHLRLELPIQPPITVFPNAQQSPATSTGSRQRAIRFRSRVRIGSLRHSSHRGYRSEMSERTYTDAQHGTDTPHDNPDAYSDSDTSSITVPLHGPRSTPQLHSPLPPSLTQPPTMAPPQPSRPMREEVENPTFVLLGPSYGWTEHTPLLPKRILPQAPRGKGTHHRRLNSDAALNKAALARAQAAAKRTEEDVRIDRIDRPYLSLNVRWRIQRLVCITQVVSFVVVVVEVAARVLLLLG
ncbi:hypothetical protein BKA62DRAFT_693484 [Auriculariales sp. MPI-PUGE-AT-0066]|nr:hypothetical protein BKA62DRAFT_693484 [Auriculariales sp. MPI-PUGE-AT-0066]